MISDLEAVKTAIIHNTVAVFPDFVFYFDTSPDGKLLVNYRGEWQPEHQPDDCAFLTIEHDGDRYFISHYLWNERRPYKTLKGVAKFANEELQRLCSTLRDRKAKDDAEKEFSEKSAEILKNYHAALTEQGIASRLYLGNASHYPNHLSIRAERVGTDIDISVNSSYELEVSFPYKTFRASRDAADDLIIALTKKGSA